MYKDIEEITYKDIEKFVKENDLQDKYCKGEDFEWYFRLGMLYERLRLRNEQIQ
jgi:hypothetical protein